MPTTKTLLSKKMPMSEYPILWWTLPRRSFNGSIEEATSQTIDQTLPFQLSDCGLPFTCSFTEDRAWMDKVSVVLFASVQLEAQDLPKLPRSDSQAWVLNIVLDPIDRFNPESMQALSRISWTHAWSHTFRSHFVETTLSPPINTSTFADAVIVPPVVGLVEKNRLRGLAKDKGGKAPAIWIDPGLRQNPSSSPSPSSSSASFSECKDSPSGRENYIRELLKLMDIDIYGGCLGNTPWPVHTDTQRPWTPAEIMTDYKFVFVLEEVNCLDYVSNDLADALIVGVVPVVDGPKDYSRFSPTSNALVHMDAFIVPELLVQELDAMDRNDTLYSERLSYRVPSGNDKSRLSPMFKELFDKAPSKITEAIATTTTTATTPDRHGALCGICQLARDVAENEYNWAAHKIEAEAWAREVATSAECEPQPRYLSGLPVQMNAYEEHLERQTKGENEVKGEENVLPPPLNSNPSHAVHVAVSFDNSQSDPLTVVSLPPLSLTDSANSWDPSKKLLQSQSSEIMSSFLSETYYLLFLILVLLVGVVALAMITSRNARKVITWPWRHMLYSKIPEDDCEAMSLE